MSNQKAGLDYFPLDVYIEQDDKMALIQAKHGIIGYAVVLKMFTKIYSDKGYYYPWNEETQLLFSARAGADYNKVIEIISDAIKWKIFDADKFEQCQILTSKRIQETYLEATKRRKTVELFKPYLLLNGDNVNILAGNVDIIEGNVDILKQSKVKESKVKESKEPPTPFNEIEKLYLTHCILLPSIQELTEQRKTLIKARWQKHKDLSIFENLFKKANASKFLTGSNKENWKASFDWLLNVNNMIKVLEGNYDNKKPVMGGGRRYENY